MNTPSSVLSVTQLNDILSSGAVKPIKILYTTMQNGPSSKPDIVKQRKFEYIPGSIAFDFQEQFADKSSDLSNTMLGPQEFQIQARKLGINNEDTLVVYDDYGNFCASRVWFMFMSMGHKNVFLLDGGLPAWCRAKHATVSELRKPDAVGNFVAKLNKSFEFVGKQYLADNLSESHSYVFDARSPDRFKGESAEARSHLRAGHIPESKNLHYASLQDDEGCFLPTAEIKQLFLPYADKPLIFSCGSGVTACILAQAATMIGHSQVKVYDGSWSQWGADNQLPIETGE